MRLSDYFDGVIFVSDFSKNTLVFSKKVDTKVDTAVQYIGHKKRRAECFRHPALQVKKGEEQYDKN